MTSLRQAPARIVIECDRFGRHGEYDLAKALKRFRNVSQQTSWALKSSSEPGQLVPT
jgi:hypothetical protein